MIATICTKRWKFKWPGRVGDSPVIGSGLYCDGQVGAAVATGDGEEVGTERFVIGECHGNPFWCLPADYASLFELFSR